MAWTFSDWIKEDVGSATRLTKLRCHIEEVSNAIKGPNFTHAGSSIDRMHLQKYLDSLMALEPTESAKVTTGSSASPVFTKGNPLVR